MPLIGMIDPSHKTRKSDKPGVLPPWLTLEELELEAQTDNMKWSPWTYEMIQAALGEHQERGVRISTTTLTGACPRGTVIERMEDYVDSVDNRYASLRGVLLHAMLERYARTGGIAEARFYTTIDGIELSGSPDLLTQSTIFDYKMTENPPTFGYPYRKHTEQLQIGAFIARHAEKWDLPPGMATLPFHPVEYPVTQAVVVYLGPKGPKPILVERSEEFIRPNGGVAKVKRPYVWDDTEALDFIRPRLHMMAKAFEVYPEWPTGAEDIWGGEPGWECPGKPVCFLPNCVAARKQLVWDKDGTR